MVIHMSQFENDIEFAARVYTSSKTVSPQQSAICCQISRVYQPYATSSYEINTYLFKGIFKCIFKFYYKCYTMSFIDVVKGPIWLSIL